MEQTDSPIGGGLYDRGASDVLFARLARFAVELVKTGEHVIVDATQRPPSV